MKRLFDWLDDRTGYRQLTHEALYENVPGGSRWIYVTGSMLVFAFVTQVITGLFLWMVYSPSSQTAWESVYYISYEMQGGWLLRGVHHYMAQAMVVLLPLHLIQVVLCRAYTAPREINYWLGLVLMLIVMALGLTGYLLPWDQKGYWATKVATELMSIPPGGAQIQKVVVGGSEYGHATLTRFFAMHAGVLPALLVGVLALHIAMFRKHGITAVSSTRRADEYFWPKQVFKDSAACFLMLAAVVALTCWRRAELGPPAEPTQSYGAARPEWYFLFLFQLLKKFESEIVGAIVIPSAVMAFLFLLPLIAKIRFGHVVNIVVLLALLIGAGYLTYEALEHDNYHLLYADKEPADEKEKATWNERMEAARKFHESREMAHQDFARLQELIEFRGIPRIGAAAGILPNDSEIQGPRLFRQHCASCHPHTDKEGHGIPGPPPPESADAEPTGAPNLYDFATPDWFMRFMDPKRIASAEVYGHTIHKDGEMVTEFVLNDLAEPDEEAQQILRQISLALSAEARLVRRRTEDKEASEDILKGIEGMAHMFASYTCVDCHKFRDLGDVGAAPDLTGYGSAEWLAGIIADPTHERFYGENNDRMPAFARSQHDPSKNLLSAHEIDMLVRWLRGDDRDLSALIANKTDSAEPQGDPQAGNTTGAPDSDAGTPDAGTPDAGTPATGTPATGTPATGTPDAGTPDAGTPDAGGGNATPG